MTTNHTDGSRFVRACRRQPVDATPVWFMRQAGRSLPEYRQVREGLPMLQACWRPDIVAELTMQPVRRHGVDAAIVFSDIVVPLRAAGIDVDIVAGVGPVVAAPVRHEHDVAALPSLDASGLAFLAEAVTMLVAQLGDTPLIGFAGAPFTLASYLVEGGPSRSHERTKALMYGNEPTWHALMERLADIAITCLEVQIAAGAAAVQLFDSWVGALSAADYRTYVLPHSRRIFETLSASGVPRIHFGVNTGELLPLLREAGADVVGVDFRTPLSEAAQRIGTDVALQGNLDPAVLFAPWHVVERRARQVLDDAAPLSGHVFNLGHGVLPDTDPDVLTDLVQLVHTESKRA